MSGKEITGKHVFIIPEPHMWDKSIKGRNAYVSEIENYLISIASIIETYVGEKYIIFPGDMFHQGYHTISSLMLACKTIRMLSDVCGGNLYSVVGNHELTYPQNNPFWILCSELPPRFGAFSKLPTYKSFKEGIHVVDSLDIENNHFVFGHYGRSDYDEDYSTYNSVIHIAHDTLIEPEICKILFDNYGIDISIGFGYRHIFTSGAIPITEKLKHVFVGHLHTAFGSLHLSELVKDVILDFDIQYLGSLGRTKESEVDDRNLGRVIPHFTIKNGEAHLENIPFKLNPRSMCVIEEKIQESKEAYEKKKPIRDLESSNVFVGTPKDFIMQWISNNYELQDLFIRLMSNDIPKDLLDIMNEGLQLTERTI